MVHGSQGLPREGCQKEWGKGKKALHPSNSELHCHSMKLQFPEYLVHYDMHGLRWLFPCSQKVQEEPGRQQAGSNKAGSSLGVRCPATPVLLAPHPLGNAWSMCTVCTPHVTLLESMLDLFLIPCKLKNFLIKFQSQRRHVRITRHIGRSIKGKRQNVNQIRCQDLKAQYGLCSGSNVQALF